MTAYERNEERRAIPIVFGICLLALVAFGAQAQIIPGTIKGVRNTDPIFAGAVPPVCFYPADPDAEISGTVALPMVDDVAYSLDLADFCVLGDDAPPGSVLSYATQSGSFPTGITHGDDGTITGTPTTPEVDTAVIRVTSTPPSGTPGTLDVTFEMTVESPTDTEGPVAPTGLTLTGVSTTSFQAAWSAASDPSGILKYQFSSAGNESSCTSADNNVVDITPPTVTYTRTGLTAEEDYWGKVRAVDNSAAQNVGSWSTCVQGFTLAEGGGGGGGAYSGPDFTPSGLTLLFDNGFENYAAGALPVPDALYGASQGGTGTRAASTTHAREGTKSAEFKVTRSGTTNYRQELTIKSSSQNLTASTSQLQCFGFSIYVPTDDNITMTNYRHQTHTHNSTSGRSPVTAITITANQFRWHVEEDGLGTFAIADVVENEWHDFQIRMKWRQDNTGSAELWMDGTKIINQTNIQTVWTGENQVPKLKIGIYASTWDNAGGADANGTVAHNYIDSIRDVVGNACTAGDVMPTGNRLSAP